MRKLLLISCLLLVVYISKPAVSDPGPRFEVAAWIDHFDFALVTDTEKIEGLAFILDHAQEAGSTTIWFRTHAGGAVRYPSKVEGHHYQSTIDKRIPFDSQADSQEIFSWVRYGEAEIDLLEEVVKMAKQRGLKVGVHWPFEETHWSPCLIGPYNVEHPQYWGRSKDGRLRMANCSLGYEAVIQHKLAQLDEMLDRGIEVLFIDFMRNGGYDPAFEYVEPVMESFEQKDGSWRKHVYSFITEYLRRVRKHLDASGRKIELVVGLVNINPKQQDTSEGLDWRRWIDEGLIDTLNVIGVAWSDSDPYGSTRKLYREIIETVGGRCRVLLPVRQYKHYTRGIWNYAKITGQSQPEIAKELMLIAHDVGADGIALECVDYNNYEPETRQVLKETAEGIFRYKKTLSKN